jgi:hypothetical protein
MRLAVIVAVLLTAAPLFAQGGRGGGGGGGGDFGGGGGGGGPVVRSPFDLFVDELDLEKDQVPALTTLLQSVETEAAALFQELLMRRQDMLNVETNRSSDPGPSGAYAAAATKLMALEARVFGEIYVQLTPKQKEKAERAEKGFERLEVLFKIALSAPGGRAGGGRGGPGRGAPPPGGRQ